jgi:pseudouridine kinase
VKVLVIGSSIVDLAVRPTSSVVADTSNEAEITISAGGAARNVAENLARLGCEVTLATDLAEDALGRFLLEDLARLGIASRIAASGVTGRYVALLHADGSLERGYCQTGTEHVTLDQWLAIVPDLLEFAGVVLDANLATDVLAGLAGRLRARGRPFAVETVAGERSSRVLPALPGCALVKPDRIEAATLTGLPCETEQQALECAASLRAMGASAVIVSLGARGLVFRDARETLVLPATPTEVRNVTGAGDALFATAFAGLLTGLPPPRFLDAARRAAALTCASLEAVSLEISPGIFAGPGE